MATLDESIAENISAALKFFSGHKFPHMPRLYATVADSNEQRSVRVASATKIGAEYRWIADRTYNGQERAQGLAQEQTWNVIADRLRAFP